MGKYINLENSLINNRRIIKRVGVDKIGNVKWSYECVECGLIGIATSHSIKVGKCKKCSYTKRKKYINNLFFKRFGCITVISLENNPSERGRSRCMQWWCHCSNCDFFVLLRSNSIIKKGKISCGCIQREKIGIKAKTLSDKNRESVDGMTIGNFKVIERSKKEYVSPNGKRFFPYVFVVCNFCNSVFETKLGKLKHMKSCGCQSKNNRNRGKLTQKSNAEAKEHIINLLLKGSKN